MSDQYGPYHQFVMADQRWSSILLTTFGKQAGDKRYTREGRGELGTELRKAHDEFCQARDAWYRQVGLSGVCQHDSELMRGPSANRTADK
jgi:hypothetical protein